MKYVLKFFLAIFAALPLRIHYVLSDALTFFIESVARYRRDDVMANFGKCITSRSIWGLHALRHEFYKHFSDLVVETIWFGGCHNPERLKKSRIVEVTNPEELDRLYASSPSVVIMYSHSGNWELLGGICHYSDHDWPVREDNFCVVYRKQSSKTWDSIIKDNRLAPLKDSKNFKGYIESNEIVRYMLEHKDEKKIYNIITDQRPYIDSPNYPVVTFMHHKCQTMAAAATVAHKLGLAVAYQRMSIRSRGHYNMEYVTICEDASKMSVQDIMDTYYKLLEADIEAQPANYLWTHRRWV